MPKSASVTKTARKRLSDSARVPYAPEKYGWPKPGEDPAFDAEWRKAYRASMASVRRHGWIDGDEVLAWAQALGNEGRLAIAQAAQAMRLRYTPRAQAELQSIAEYYGGIDAGVANRIVFRIASAASKLTTHPSLGRRGRIRGTHEMVVQGTPYLIAFRRGKNTVDIVMIRHGARRWPRRL